MSKRGVQSECQIPRGRGQEGLQLWRKTSVTHSKDLDGEAHVVLPGYTQDIWQVQCEVDDAPTGCCQVGPGEERANEEAL